jgi:RsiW-degrading membrane proteinase PrsW (M82 family)
MYLKKNGNNENQMGKINILFVKGPRTGESLVVDSNDTITFGRDKKCDIVLSDSGSSSISRNHAKLINGTITDTSTNGTYVDGKKIHNSSVKLNGNEKIKFSSKGDTIQINLNEFRGQSNDSDISEVPSFTKIVPVSKPGFIKELSSQPFFIPGLVTVIVGILLFGILNGAEQTRNIAYLYMYELLLGAYFGTITIFFIQGVSNLKVPFWIPLSSALFIALMFFIDVPFYLLSIIFRPDAITSLLDSNNFLELFIAHFVAAGLMEELFKSIPVWIACFLAPRLYRLNIGGFKKEKITPTLTVLIGASGAIGFIIVETLFNYVPEIQEDLGLEWGLMLLIPRFITGIAGHVAWSGIFAYFIGLMFYYKKVNISYPIMGWLLASVLHGLWNATGGSIWVAVISFVGFTGYLFKARDAFQSTAS